MSKLPLQGIRVLEFGVVRAGPYCAAFLVGLGAEVIKIEEPLHGDDTRAWAPFQDGVSTFFLGMNRSKKSVALDLKTPDGAEALRRLIRTADVLIDLFTDRDRGGFYTTGDDAGALVAPPQDLPDNASPSAHRPAAVALPRLPAVTAATRLPDAAEAAVTLHR